MSKTRTPFSPFAPNYAYDVVDLYIMSESTLPIAEFARKKMRLGKTRMSPALIRSIDDKQTTVFLLQDGSFIEERREKDASSLRVLEAEDFINTVTFIKGIPQQGNVSAAQRKMLLAQLEAASLKKNASIFPLLASDNGYNLSYAQLKNQL